MKTAAGIRKVTVELYVHYIGRCLNDFSARFSAKFFAVPTVHPLRYLDVIVSTLVVMLQFKVQYYQSYHTALGDSYLPIAFRLMHVRHRIIRRYDIALGGRQRSTASWNVGRKEKKKILVRISARIREERRGRRSIDSCLLSCCPILCWIQDNSPSNGSRISGTIDLSGLWSPRGYRFRRTCRLTETFRNRRFY